MRAKILTTAIFSTIITSTIAYAVASDNAFEKYNNNLKNCTPSSGAYKTETKNFEYTIKGKLPNGRCEVDIKESSDFYKYEIQWICKFSEQERKILYEANQKHDDGNVVKYNKDYDLSFMPHVCYMPRNKNEKLYACEYADITCYYWYYGEGKTSLYCSNGTSEKSISPAIKNKVEEHINAGMCNKLK